MKLSANDSILNETTKMLSLNIVFSDFTLEVNYYENSLNDCINSYMYIKNKDKKYYIQYYNKMLGMVSNDYLLYKTLPDFEKLHDFLKTLNLNEYDFYLFLIELLNYYDVTKMLKNTFLSINTDVTLNAMYEMIISKLLSQKSSNISEF